MLCIIAAASSKIVKIFIVYKVNYALISFASLFSQLLSNKSPQSKKNQSTLSFMLCNSSISGTTVTSDSLTSRMHLVHYVNPDVL